MRTAKLITDYETFATIRRWYNKHYPYALLKESYDRDINEAIFSFWDGDYIVPQLRPHVVGTHIQPEAIAEASKGFPEVHVIE